MSLRKEVLAKVKALPAMPSTAAKIIAMVQDPKISIDAFADMAAYDPGLTANVLRLANSAYFGSSRPVHSMKEAVIRLGTKRIFELVMALLVSRVEGQAVKGYDLPPGALWLHSVAVAVGSRELAKELGWRIPDYAFTAGLLHDVGKLVLGTFFHNDVDSILEAALDRHLSFEIAEQEVLGIDHAEVGAYVLENWNLPHALVDVVRYHHEPGTCPTEHQVADLVHVADALALLEGIGAGNDGLNYRPSVETLSRLPMTSQVVEIVTYRMLQALDEVNGLFVDYADRCA